MPVNSSAPIGARVLPFGGLAERRGRPSSTQVVPATTPAAQGPQARLAIGRFAAAPVTPNQILRTGGTDLPKPQPCPPAEESLGSPGGHTGAILDLQA